MPNTAYAVLRSFLREPVHIRSCSLCSDTLLTKYAFNDIKGLRQRPETAGLQRSTMFSNSLHLFTTFTLAAVALSQASLPSTICFPTGSVFADITSISELAQFLSDAIGTTVTGLVTCPTSADCTALSIDELTEAETTLSELTVVGPILVAEIEALSSDANLIGVCSRSFCLSYKHMTEIFTSPRPACRLCGSVSGCICS